MKVATSGRDLVESWSDWKSYVCVGEGEDGISGERNCSPLKFHMEITTVHVACAFPLACLMYFFARKIEIQQNWIIARNCLQVCKFFVGRP